MKTSTPLTIAILLIIALALSMLTSCNSNTEEQPIATEAAVLQDIYLKGSILYFRDKPVVLQDSAKDLLKQGLNNLPRVATYVVEYKNYYYMALD